MTEAEIRSGEKAGICPIMSMGSIARAQPPTSLVAVGGAAGPKKTEPMIPCIGERCQFYQLVNSDGEVVMGKCAIVMLAMAAGKGLELAPVIANLALGAKAFQKADGSWSPPGFVPPPTGPTPVPDPA